MHFTKFIIQNFKGIKNLEIDLEKEPKSKIQTLVGLNESGKSTILEAISLLLSETSLLSRHTFIPKHEKYNFNGDIKIIGFIKVSDSDNTLIREFVKSKGFFDFESIDTFKITSLFKFEKSNNKSSANEWDIPLRVKDSKTDKYYSLINRDKEKWLEIILYIKKTLLPRILYYRDFLFDFPNKIYLNEEYSKEKNQLEFREIIQDILSLINSDLNIEEHLVKRIKSKKEADIDALDQLLSKMSGAVSQIVLDAWRSIINIKGKEIIIKSGFETENNQYYLEFKLKEGVEQYFISERSLGFKWFFTFLLFTEIRKYRKTDLGETIFLLDEPASNLHSTAQQKLLAKFAKLTEKCRLIYTTHSHHLINPKWLNGIYIVRNKGIDYKDDFLFDTKNTDIEATLYKNFVATYPTQTDYFKPILDTLEYKPGLLEKVPNIIVTEGKFDYYTLKYVNEIIFENEYKNLNFYPGNGANQNFLVISLYLAWSKPFIILLDSDKAGIRAKELYIKEFGEVVRSHIITYNEIFSGIGKVPMEDIFNDDEKLKITKLFRSEEKKFDKSKFNTSIQNLYMENKTFELSEETSTKFSKLLGGLYEKQK